MSKTTTTVSSQSQRTGDSTTQTNVSGNSPSSTPRPAPKFPSPSEPSKWLMLYWFAGFPREKIHWLLSQYFNIDGHDAYKVENLEQTFHQLQRNANRNNPDYYSEPYMYYIMTSKGSSPFEFRKSATRYLDKHHPKIVEEMTEDDEIREMNLWHSRWFEEVRLMHKSKVPEYLDRADTFEAKLDYYSCHFDAKGHVAYFEDEASIRSVGRSMSRSSTFSQNRASSHSPESLRSFGDDVPRQIIERPKLKCRTKVGKFFRSSKKEGIPTPSKAQNLDNLGFFAQRPKKNSVESVVEIRSRTPSVSSSTEGSFISDKSSLQVHLDAQRRPSAS